MLCSGTAAPAPATAPCWTRCCPLLRTWSWRRVRLGSRVQRPSSTAVCVSSLRLPPCTTAIMEHPVDRRSDCLGQCRRCNATGDWSTASRPFQRAATRACLLTAGNAGATAAGAAAAAAAAAQQGAEGTARMAAGAGRSSYVPAHVLQATPDPGATAAAIWIGAVAKALAG